MKQTRVRRERNVATKRNIKSALKIFTAEPTAKSLSDAQSAIDTAVKKNLLPKIFKMAGEPYAFVDPKTERKTEDQGKYLDTNNLPF